MASNKLTAPGNPATKVTTVVHSLLDGLHQMSKSETIIGDAYQLGDATIVPVHRLRVALGAGALHGGARQDATNGESGGLGAGGAVQIEPVAVIAMGRDGVPRVMCVETEEHAADKVMKQLPDLVANAAKIFSERLVPLLSKLQNKGNAAATTKGNAEIKEAEPALLASKTEPKE